jgi:hypothetical protein
MRAVISKAPTVICFLVASCILGVVAGFQFAANNVAGSSGAGVCLAMAIAAAVCAGVEIRDGYHKTNCMK